jgi:hypothetical protein
MPITKTLKNKKSGSRIIKFHGSPVPIVLTENSKRGITYKLPANLLEPKDLLKAKQKNKANVAKLQEEIRRSKVIEAERAKKERLESQARFASMLRDKASETNNGGIQRRGPGTRGSTIPPNLLRMMRGETTSAPRSLKSSTLVSLLGNSSGTRTLRKANLLRLERAASKEKHTSTLWGNLNSD